MRKFVRSVTRRIYTDKLDDVSHVRLKMRERLSANQTDYATQTVKLLRKSPCTKHCCKLMDIEEVNVG